MSILRGGQGTAEGNKVNDKRIDDLLLLFIGKITDKPDPVQQRLVFRFYLPDCFTLIFSEAVVINGKDLSLFEVKRCD